MKTYGVKYEKAARKLTKDRDVLLTFWAPPVPTSDCPPDNLPLRRIGAHFPADHWVHLRTTNPIESTFATVRHRTKRTKGCMKRETARIMTFKLIKEAEKSWLKLRGKNSLPKLIEGITFENGIETNEMKTKNAA